MSIKDSFTEEEWAGVLQAPLLAGFAVTAADPSGLWGAVQESAAVAGSLADAAKSPAEGSIIMAVVEAYKTSEGRGIAREGTQGLIKGKRPAEASTAAVARLGDVSSAVRAKAPDQAAAFAQWIREIAAKVAEAGTEGGFMGFGGEKVSESERKTLAEIEKVLV